MFVYYSFKMYIWDHKILAFKDKWLLIHLIQVTTETGLSLNIILTKSVYKE